MQMKENEIAKEYDMAAVFCQTKMSSFIESGEAV